MAALLGWSGCKDAVCAKAELDKVVSALDTIGPEHRAELAAMGLVESCTNPKRPVPAGLAASLRGASSGGPYARLAILKGLADEPALWTSACAGSEGALGEALQLAPGDGARSLVAKCKAAESGMGSASELERLDVAAIALGLAVHQWLLDGDVSKRQARALARTVAGL